MRNTSENIKKLGEAGEIHRNFKMCLKDCDYLTTLLTGTDGLDNVERMLEADIGGAWRPSILILLSDSDSRRSGKLFCNWHIIHSSFYTQLYDGNNRTTKL